MATDAPDGYRCGICSQWYDHPSLIYGCNYGHFFCQKCYKQVYYTGNEPVCPHPSCKAEICRMDKYTITRVTTPKKKGKKMFPEPELIAEEIVKDAISKKSLHSFSRGDNTSTNCLTHSSRKPVNCPYPRCEKTVAVTAVDAHFKYEHKFVAFISTYFDTRNGLEFNPYDVKYSEKLCIVLINILDEQQGPRVISRNNLRMLHGRATANPVMLVLATRVPFYQQNESDDLGDEEEDDYELCSSPAVDKIILWVASNVPTSKYTLAVSTSCKAIRLKYFGMVSQINDNCVKLCENGKGLILNQPHIIGMTNNGKKPLTLDIVLHKEDPEGKNETIGQH